MDHKKQTISLLRYSLLQKKTPGEDDVMSSTDQKSYGLDSEGSATLRG